MNSETGISKSQVLAIAVFNLAEQLQLKEFELALILGLSEAELSLVINEKELEPDTTAGEKAIALVNIYQKLFSLHGGDLSWMRQFINSPNKLLDQQTPRSLMQTEHGLSEVLRLLGRLQPY
ncbi:DUF2384 domain-containing protein [Acinetobacter lwoffii]|jgi:uncharacterized protein (DUF2384 family)|uniref:DUF2384 domain-containing protein n=1 Tax=Acinetobacter lwoffii TaxID=28090 RepID=A0A646MKD5_ACILW|nr:MULTISPECIES: antitoxin Xre/MbcA/ParS toxin-binding domain-containing protein [Pseudomonadota]ODN53744.1 hypothetical protein A9Z54_03480 [Acinetobacter sp. 51m]EEY90066.1 putative toxin-antitoxin system antitoxin component, TIGR02293 family [Acinetobacter lwoffii SH145]ENW28294.1 hypothetical protein F924_01635 [Acinetobacter lwoffii ATCC 9957 = CIP 70.31]MCO8061585.1 MbcA/ParS/Xre antitoxin family protein [Acinetobacter lwoffii]MCU4421801.1 MbcA/ParS/Xre antitoxin family protein [Acinetob